MHLTKLLLGHLAGSSAHRVLRVAVHGEGHYLTDVFLIPKKHDYPFNPRGHAGVRWRSVLKCIIQRSELLFQGLLIIARYLKSLDHDIQVVVPYRARG